MNVLAIDPATKTGWATASHYGVWNIKRKANETDGIKWLRFRKLLTEYVEEFSINLIAYERPGGRHSGSLIHHSKIVGIIEEFCAERNIEYKGYSSTQIKKIATGRGNANKAAVVSAAQTELSYTGDDDNEADALWLYELVCQELGI